MLLLLTQLKVLNYYVISSRQSLCAMSEALSGARSLGGSCLVAIFGFDGEAS